MPHYISKQGRRVAALCRVSVEREKEIMMSKRFERLMRAAGAAAAKVGRRHLPSLGPTSIIVSLDPIELGALEVWIS